MNLEDAQLEDTLTTSQYNNKGGRGSPFPYNNNNDLNENNISQIEEINGMQVMDEENALNKHEIMYTFSSKRVDSNNHIQELA